MTIAEKIQSYYESDDFESNYAHLMLEDSDNCIAQIKEIAKNEYEFEEYYGKNINLTTEQAEEVLNHIRENMDDFQGHMSNYWVGHTCVDSVSFGEQEEQLEGIYNHQTGKDYTLPYLRKAFDDAGYYVTDNNYAYYNLSGSGLRIDLIMVKIPLIEELVKNV